MSTNKQPVSLRSHITRLEAENKKLKATMEYLWKLEFIDAGQYGYAVRANTAEYVDENVRKGYLIECALKSEGQSGAGDR